MGEWRVVRYVTEGETPNVAGSMCRTGIFGEGRQRPLMSDPSMTPSHLSLVTLTQSNSPVSESPRVPVLRCCQRSAVGCHRPSAAPAGREH